MSAFLSVWKLHFRVSISLSVTEAKIYSLELNIFLLFTQSLQIILSQQRVAN